MTSMSNSKEIKIDSSSVLQSLKTSIDVTMADTSANKFVGKLITNERFNKNPHSDMNIRSNCGSALISVDQSNAAEKRNLLNVNANDGSTALARKKSVTFVENTEHSDLDVIDVKIISRRSSSKVRFCFNSDSNENISCCSASSNESTVKSIIQMDDSDLLALSTPTLDSLKTNNNNEKQQIDSLTYDRLQMTALRDASAEIVNYVMNNAIKIVVNEMKCI